MSFLNFCDSATPACTVLSGQFLKSFAFRTLNARIPTIINSLRDHMLQDKEKLVQLNGAKSSEEIEKIDAQLCKLKDDLQSNKTLEQLTGNEPDTCMWNEFLRELPADKSSYYHACWLYAECYLYRKISSIFKATSTLQNYDYFGKQKENAMLLSDDTMEAIARATCNTEKSEEMLAMMLKLTLWGNRSDLSITTGKEEKPSTNPWENLKVLDANVLIDNTAAIWKCLKSPEQGAEDKPVIVDLICDNAGFELFTDLVLAKYLIEKQLASKVRFNVKAIPWFISDVTPKDYHWALKYFKNHENSEVLRQLGTQWCDLNGQGKFELAPIEYFWTSPYEFYRMSSVNLPLYKRLSEARLIIFKGDLNYRKLLGDFNWDYTEEFTTCLRGFRPSNLCSLRTVKADLICGLQPGQAEALFEIKKEWMYHGDYGTIQFAAKNSHAEQYDEI